MRILACLLAAVLVTGIVSKPVESDVASLYDANDNVTELNGETFNSTIFNSPHMWMVEFYSSWCGHCQAFAPIFKAFAKDIADWNGVYRLAVINCPDKPNRDLCSIMNVKGYPEMRVFPPFSTPGSKVLFIKDEQVKALRESSVKVIDQYLDEVKWTLPGKAKPTFRPMTFAAAASFHKSDKSSYYLALIVGDDPRDIGKEVILDMSSCGNITVRKFDNDPDEISKLEKFTAISFEELPTVVVLSKDGTSKEIQVNFKRRSFYTYKLQKLPGVGEPEMIPKSTIPVHTERSYSKVDWKKVDRSKVYTADLESGLQYALSVEVASLKLLEGETLSALRQFVGTLDEVCEQLPVSETSKNFLSDLVGWLVGQSRIKRKDWLKRVQTKETQSFLPQIDQRWVGCAPSKPGLRGYPCSLWTLFHTLSVAAYNANVRDVIAVPRAMEAYITTFFSCKECQKNFVKELEKFPYRDYVSTHKQAILWMWDLHNEVNKRLHGEISEDPNIPKLQYPPKSLCPECRNSDGSWNREKVSRHLIRRYSIGAVSAEYMNVDGNSNLDGNMRNSMKIEETLLADIGDRNFVNKNIDDWHRLGSPKLLWKESGERNPGNYKSLLEKIKKEQFLGQQHKLLIHPSTDLSSLDASLCIVLWGTSLVVLTMVYCYLKRRKMYKSC